MFCLRTQSLTSVKISYLIPLTSLYNKLNDASMRVTMLHKSITVLLKLLTVLLKSNHPSPATIHSMNWEGDYSPRYYQRV